MNSVVLIIHICSVGRADGVIDGKEDAELSFAVKTIKEGSSTETKEDFFKEVALMSLLHHKNIVELLAVLTEEKPYGMIFEFMELGNLNQFLRKAGPFFEGNEKERGLTSLRTELTSSWRIKLHGNLQSCSDFHCAVLVTVVILLRDTLMRTPLY